MKLQMLQTIRDYRRETSTGPASVKTILVLANSYKHHGRCIAGREVIDENGQLQVGRWMRPNSDRPGGEFSIDECRLHDRSEPQLFDLVRIPILRGDTEPSQPDNWIVRSGMPWRHLGDAIGRVRLADLLERPDNLWLEPRRYSDRVSIDFVARNPPRQSLYLIRPEFFEIEVVPRVGSSPRYRAVFSYSGVTYRLGLTDPCLIHQYCMRYANVVDRLAFQLPSGSNVALCVSLAREFNGCHYKVVATVFEGVA